MKRLVALVLALAALLGFSALAEPAAPAESMAGIIHLSDLALAYADEDGMRSVRFENSSLTAAIGKCEGAPTIQINFDNGNGQMVDGVIQLDGQQVLLSMGGISGIYAIDLQAFAGEGNSAEETARGLTHALDLAGTHLDVVLYAVTRERSGGMRSVEMPLPMPSLISAAESLLSVTRGMQATDDVDLDDLNGQMEALDAEAMMGFRYSPETGAFELAAVQNGRGMCFSGTMKLTHEPMTFINIMGDEERLDALHLTDEDLEELRGELDMVLVKYADFVTAVGLGDVMP